MAIKLVQPLYKFLGKEKSIYLQDNGAPKTILVVGETGKGKSSLASRSSDRSEQKLKEYWNYYSGEGTIFASINITAWNAVMVGKTIISDDPNAKALVTQFFDNIDLDSCLLENTGWALVFGDSFIEKVRDKSTKRLVDVKTANPMTMTINSDKFGRDETYQQVIGGKPQQPLEKDELIHLKFFPRPDSVYGLSLIEPSKDTIDRKVQTDDAIANAIIRHGTSKYVVTIGDKDNIPPASVFSTIEGKLEDITEQNEFIVPGLVKIETIDEKGIQGVEEYYNFFQTQLIIGLLCPEEALGLGRGSTEATASVKQIMYERMIKSIQHKLEHIVRTQMINPLLVENGFQPNTVVMKFKSVTDTDEAIKAKWLAAIQGVYPGIKPFTINEIRAMFDYPPLPETETGQEVPPPNKPEQPQPPTNQPPQQPPQTPQPNRQEVQQSDIQNLNKKIDMLMSEISNIKGDLSARKSKKATKHTT